MPKGERAEGKHMCNDAAAHRSKQQPCTFFFFIFFWLFMFPKKNTRQQSPNSQVTEGWISVLRPSSPEADGHRSLLGLCITDTQPLGQSKAQSPSRGGKCALRAGSRPLPQSCCWPASCLDGLQLLCSLAGRALILNWLNFTKIRHFGISLKVKQCSLFPTIHCTSLSTPR